MGRPGERVAVMRSTRVRTSSSRGTMRSESSLPSGTLSQDPCPGISWMQSSSRSSNSPIRSPQARCTNSASAASRKHEPDSAAVSFRSASTGRYRGRKRCERGRSVRKISRRGGASSHPHSVISARKFPTAWTRLIRSATVIGSPVMLLAAVVSEVMNGSMCRRRSSSASDVKVGSTAARYLPK